MVFSTSMQGKLDFSMQNSEMRPLSFILHKTQLHLDQGPQHKTSYPETARGKSRVLFHLWTQVRTF